MNAPTNQPPKKLRRQYTNSTYPMVVLKFEDGHEIKIYQHSGKVFDAWSGETIKDQHHLIASCSRIVLCQEI